jgi:hypothetical protein
VGLGKKLPDGIQHAVDEVKREEGALVVRVLSKESCGGVTPEDPRVQVSSNKVALSWRWHGELVIGRECVHQLEFRITGAPSGEVVVTAEPVSR